jgi:hypothetical protein
MHGVSLSDFQFDVTFRAAQDFAFFHFVFVEIKFCVAFRAFRHGRTLLPGAILHSEGYYITPLSSFAKTGAT